MVVILPPDHPSRRLVTISHGLGDGPESFSGWGRHLASHGCTVRLPRHPGAGAPDLLPRQGWGDDTLP